MGNTIISLDITAVCITEGLERSFFNHLKIQKIRWAQCTIDLNTIKLLDSSDFKKLHEVYPEIIKI